MFDTAQNDNSPRRRFWMTEVLLIAGILAFGGFALFSEARIAPADLATVVGEILAR